MYQPLLQKLLSSPVCMCLSSHFFITHICSVCIRLLLYYTKISDYTMYSHGSESASPSSFPPSPFPSPCPPPPLPPSLSHSCMYTHRVILSELESCVELRSTMTGLRDRQGTKYNRVFTSMKFHVWGGGGNSCWVQQ